MTTTLSLYELAHLVQVVRHSANGYRAECVCGWAGAWCDDPVTADDHAVDHREVAAGPPRDLDRAISGLLDLQDDLAEMVIWLAENWSADLPVPSAQAWTDYSGDTRGVPGFSLLAYSDSGDDIAGMSELLGVPVVPDRVPDSLGNRYERATRRFGRVRLTAYRQIGREPAP
jgi:hypothetical protein